MIDWRKVDITIAIKDKWIEDPLLLAWWYTAVKILEILKDSSTEKIVRRNDIVRKVDIYGRPVLIGMEFWGFISVDADEPKLPTLYRGEQTYILHQDIERHTLLSMRSHNINPEKLYRRSASR